ncbi:hypothetical protein [uncultured Pseudokineococcus sp.]|uniref:hypothetical protein n=1 Tax=uncultured Pseudokineococcus sp. TaxID=1642928 RepID=UPI0026265C3A|nr:hypothetical protein [uncultured Pseudokineococcus sp.]
MPHSDHEEDDMARAGGPMEAGGFEEYVLDDGGGGGEGYAVRLFPDLNNEELQRDGQPPQFYWSPQQLRLARFPDTGDFKFSHTHFRGVLDESHVGVEETTETVGGLLNLTVTSRMPPAVMAQLQEQVTERLRGDSRPFWRVLGNRQPDITMVPVRSNTASMSSLAPDSPGLQDATPVDDPGSGLERSLRTKRGIVADRDLRGTSNLDLWAVQLDGIGPGSITGGENAYGGLLGGIPSELVWAAMHGNASPFFVSQTLMIPMATPVVEISIVGHWQKCLDHFSAEATGGVAFFAADVAVQLEEMQRSGDIEVTMVVDQTVPGADAVAERLEKTKDLVTQKFIDLAKETIFAPATPVEAAEARKKKGWWNLGVAMKVVKKKELVDLRYTESQIWKYNRQDVISSTLEGLRREIAADEQAAGKYFHLVSLGDLNRKVRRITRPVANWLPDPEQQWAGDPVKGLAVEFGYPNTRGEIGWKGNQFVPAGGADQVWEPEWVQLTDEEMSDRPDGWEPDQTYVRRKVILGESSSALADPYNRVVVERNTVDLDPEPRLSDEISVDVRADNAGVLEVGPIQLGVVLDGSSQVVEVSVRPLGTTVDGRAREVVTFSFNGTDQDVPRRLKIYTGDPDYVPAYEYQVRVVVKGTLFTDGMEWGHDEDTWLSGLGNGPLTVSVPRPGTEGTGQPRALRREQVLSLPSGSEDARGERGQPRERQASGERPTSNGSTPNGSGRSAERRVTVDGYDLSASPPAPPEFTGHAR